MTKRAAISRFPVSTFRPLPGEVRDRIVAVRDEGGIVPEMFLARAHRAAALRASDALASADSKADIGARPSESPALPLPMPHPSICPTSRSGTPARAVRPQWPR